MPIFSSGSGLSDKKRGGGGGLEGGAFIQTLIWGGGAVSKKNFFGQIGLKIRGAPGPLPFPRSTTAIYNYLYNSVST